MNKEVFPKICNYDPSYLQLHQRTGKLTVPRSQAEVLRDQDRRARRWDYALSMTNFEWAAKKDQRPAP